VLVLSPPWRTVLVIVIERFACMGSTRLALRSTNRRSQTRGSCSLSPLVYPLPNSRPSSALTRMEYYNRTLDRAREAPHRLPGTDLDPWCGTSKASTVWRQVAIGRLATGGYGRRPPLPQRVSTRVVLGDSRF